MRPALTWPREAALPAPADAVELVSPPSNLVLDLHGEPQAAKLHLFSDGNHHMALADTVAAFVRSHPDVGDVFYATTPPRIILGALDSGGIEIGNVRLATRPDVFICPVDILEGLQERGIVAKHRAFMRSRGLAMLVAKGNPKSVVTAGDLLRADVRLCISNPVTEKASFDVYERAIVALANDGAWSEDAIRAQLRSNHVVKSQVIHHREVPELIASGAADASVVYHHLALRYQRIFPDQLECMPLAIEAAHDAEIAEAIITRYHVGLIGDGGAFGAAFEQFLFSDEVTEIYAHHGLSRPSDAA